MSEILGTADEKYQVEVCLQCAESSIRTARGAIAGTEPWSKGLDPSWAINGAMQDLRNALKVLKSQNEIKP